MEHLFEYQFALSDLSNHPFIAYVIGMLVIGFPTAKFTRHFANKNGCGCGNCGLGFSPTGDPNCNFCAFMVILSIVLYPLIAAIHVLCFLFKGVAWLGKKI